MKTKSLRIHKEEKEGNHLDKVCGLNIFISRHDITYRQAPLPNENVIRMDRVFHFDSVQTASNAAVVSREET